MSNSISVFTLEDKVGNNIDYFETQDYQEAEREARERNFRIIEHTYEWTDSSEIEDYTNSTPQMVRIFVDATVVAIDRWEEFTEMAEGQLAWKSNDVLDYEFVTIQPELNEALKHLPFYIRVFDGDEDEIESDNHMGIDDARRITEEVGTELTRILHEMKLINEDMYIAATQTFV